MAQNNLATTSFQQGDVTIAVSNSDFGGGHIGIGFHSVKSGAQVLHLAWHRQMRVEAIPQELKTCWSYDVLSIPPLASKQVVSYVRVVASRLPAINYGTNFVASKGSFSQTGSYRPPKGSVGLTCASFVLEVLRGASLTLINERSWPTEPVNGDWAELVCAALKRSAADDGHIEAVRTSANGLRLRPFELAGAASLTPAAWPAHFDAVQEPAKDVANQLARICQAPVAVVAVGIVEDPLVP